MPEEGEEVNVGATVELLISIGPEEKEEENQEEQQVQNNSKPSSSKNNSSNNNSSNSSTSKPTQTPEKEETVEKEPVKEEPQEPEIVNPESVSITTDINKFYATGATINAQATVSPSNASNKEIVWSSSNSSRATVTQSGVIKVIGTGEVTITATIKGTNIKTSKTFYGCIAGITGDVTKDGAINSIDAAIIYDIIGYGDFTADNIRRGDINGDGTIDKTDADLIIDIYLYGIEE